MSTAMALKNRHGNKLTSDDCLESSTPLAVQVKAELT